MLNAELIEKYFNEAEKQEFVDDDLEEDSDEEEPATVLASSQDTDFSPYNADFGMSRTLKGNSENMFGLDSNQYGGFNDLDDDERDEEDAEENTQETRSPEE